MERKAPKGRASSGTRRLAPGAGAFLRLPQRLRRWFGVDVRAVVGK